jgi:hypothetical protein
VQNKVNAGTTGRGTLLVNLRARETYCGKFGKVVQSRVNAGIMGKGTQLVSMRARGT